MTEILRATMIELVADNNPEKRWISCWLEVTPAGDMRATPRWGACIPRYRMMCDAIMADIQSPEGGGKSVLENIRKIETGEADDLWFSGNAWEVKMGPDIVTFEGLYGQGCGGAVTLQQYKTAVQTYVQFLGDPEHKVIEVQLPEPFIQ